MKKVFFAAFIITAACKITQAQSVAVNTDGSTPHASAILDIKNPNKGLLIPRVSLISETDVTTISSPLVSLLIYNSNNALPDGDGYYYWNGSKWTKLATRLNLSNLAWNVAGNTGTNPANDFIGTTDNKALVFKTNNVLSGKIDPVPNNVFLGNAAGLSMNGGTNNAFFGHFAGQSTTTGTGNLFAGHNAGSSNTTGNANVFLGQGAGKSNTGGIQNTFIGEDAGFNNISGSSNVFIGNNTGSGSQLVSNTVAVGTDALSAANSGISNTAVGYSSLKVNTTGYSNTAFGSNTMIATTTGILNTAVGKGSLLSNTSGSGNVALGYASLDLNQTGDFNTAVGYVSGPSSGLINLTNTTCLGYRSEVSTSNTMTFGNISVDRWAFGITTTNANHALEVGSTAFNGNGAYLTQGGAWTNASDENKKEDITAVNGTELLQKISSLTVSKWKYKGSSEYHIGPMAQDFYKLFGLGTDDRGISTIDPAGIALAAIQEQQKMIASLNHLILQLRAEMNSLKEKLTRQ